MKSILLFFAAFLVSSISCEQKEALTPSNDCDALTEISASKYENASSSGFEIMDVSIVDNCLEITYSSSGCDGSSWLVELVDSGEILESAPPQRNLKLSIENLEACLAFITQTKSFDISNLQLNGSNVYLNIKNSEERILYEY